MKVRVITVFILVISCFGGPVDFDCTQIRDDTNEPALLKKIK